MSNNNSEKMIMLLPGIGIVFGSGVGMQVSTLYSFPFAVGMICGASAGLLIGIIVSLLSGKGSNAKG